MLAPIAFQPNLSFLPQANRELLEKLVKCSKMQIVVISGRLAIDVQNHIGISGIYVGNHGVEIVLNGARESHAGGDRRLAPVEMRTQMEEIFAGFKDVLLEDKVLALDCIIAKLTPPTCPPLKERLRTGANLPPPLQHSRKNDVEVRPKTAWNKGNALWHIWQFQAPQAALICLGRIPHGLG